ncbi:MAG: glycosyltransferase family 2 protein [bacterium]|nr:glycosyltransferase family 2 protein [bacterium]
MAEIGHPAKTRIDLTISVVHHRDKKFLEKCLDSILKETKNITFEIFVVDNCSNDKIPELLKEKYSGVKLIRNDKIEGFAKNHNKVLEKAEGKYVAVLNNDIVLLDNTLDKLVGYLKNHPQLGGVACKVYVGNNSALSTPAKKFFTPTNVFLDTFFGVSGLRKIFPKSIFLQEIPFGKINPEKICNNVISMSGCCMVMKKKAVEDIGLFDESFFLYLEDTDLFYRLRKKGWLIGYYPKASVFHYGCSSIKSFSKTQRKLYEKSFNRFFYKHYGQKAVVLYKLLTLLIAIPVYFHSLYLEKRNRTSRSGGDGTVHPNGVKQ